MARSKPTDTPAPSGKAGRGPASGGRGRGSSAATGRTSGKGTGEKKPGRLKRFGSQLGMIKQAYSLTRKNDPKLPWILLITFVAVAGVIELIAILLGAPYLFIPIAVLMGLLAAEKKKVARGVGDTPIYDIVVGDDEGQVPLKKLSSHVMKLPRNLTAAEVNALGKRMSALGGARMPVPGGPLPGGRQMSVSQRQVRRR